MNLKLLELVEPRLQSLARGVGMQDGINVSSADPSIVCSLDGGDFHQRLKWIADLNVRALISARQDDLRLELKYDAAAVLDVRQLVAQERQCCAFLAFSFMFDPDGVRVVVTAPAEAREAARELFVALRSKPPRAIAACGCHTACTL